MLSLTQVTLILADQKLLKFLSFSSEILHLEYYLLLFLMALLNNKIEQSKI